MAICVEITMNDDGSLKVVECEPEAPEMEGQEGEGGGQSFEDIESAMQAAAQILTSGQEQDPMAAAQAGYAKGAPAASNRPTAQAVFGEGM